MGGAERARIRGGCGPRGLAGQERERTARTMRGRGGRPRPPRGPPALERCGARRGRTMTGAGRTDCGCHGPRRGRGLHRLRGASRRLLEKRDGLYQARGPRRRRGVVAAEPLRRAGEARRLPRAPRGAWPGRTKMWRGA